MKSRLIRWWLFAAIASTASLEAQTVSIERRLARQGQQIEKIRQTQLQTNQRLADLTRLLERVAAGRGQIAPEPSTETRRLRAKLADMQRALEMAQSDLARERTENQALRRRVREAYPTSRTSGTRPRSAEVRRPSERHPTPSARPIPRSGSSSRSGMPDEIARQLEEIDVKAGRKPVRAKEGRSPTSGWGRSTANTSRDDRRIAELREKLRDLEKIAASWRARGQSTESLRRTMDDVKRELTDLERARLRRRR